MRTRQQGSALLLVIIVFAVLGALLGMGLQRGEGMLRKIQREHVNDSAFYLAEGGLEYALDKITRTSDGDVYGQETVQLDTGIFTISISRRTPSGNIEILSTGIATGPIHIGKVEKTLRIVGQIALQNSGNAFSILSREEL